MSDIDLAAPVQPAAGTHPVAEANLFHGLRRAVLAEIASMAAAGELPPGLDTGRVAVEPPREAAHGDVTTNAAMVLAKPAARKPREIAEALVARLRALPHVTGAEIAGPGFINLRLADGFWRERLRVVLRAGTAYGRCDIGAGRAVNVEYVSANPTGPLHAAHARGAVIGDALANLLEVAGFAVTREYYINDAGSQVDTLARSAFLRYREALGEAIGKIPEGYYPGEYLKDVGQALAAKHGPALRDLPEAQWLETVKRFAVDALMAEVREDLRVLGVRHAVFTSERAMVESGGVERAVDWLKAHGDVYTGTLEPPKGKLPDDWEPRPQLLFRATRYGDEIDRPLQKSDGSWTYFANDIAYHHDKFRRGFAEMIDVLGADHGGYVKRMQAAVKAITEGKGALDVKLCQLVHLMDAGKPVKMSKRAGTFVTLRDVVEAVGKDVVRFIMLTRRNDQALEFDYAKVKEQSRENPVFYVQYAHARARSVLRHAAEELPGADLSAAGLASCDLAALQAPEELQVIKIMADWPRLVEGAAEAHEPHRVAFYLADLAAAFHGLWNRGKDDARLRFIQAEDRAGTLARLALVQAVALVAAAGLRVFGVEPVEEMR
ncbi:MAG: arginine--tRNA ligase [Alphaproteobacteria bacterium]|nr:arginine--tRNA ligase [Alphaproteobacteria bacterium]